MVSFWVLYGVMRCVVSSVSMYQLSLSTIVTIVKLFIRYNQNQNGLNSSLSWMNWNIPSRTHFIFRFKILFFSFRHPNQPHDVLIWSQLNNLSVFFFHCKFKRWNQLQWSRCKSDVNLLLYLLFWTNIL